MEPFRPELWHDFFLMVGGGSAALTGLVFVAMSLHLDAITGDPALRHRARSTLTLRAQEARSGSDNCDRALQRASMRR